MDLLVLFWSQNADLYLLFSHILAADGFRSILVKDEDLAELARQACVIAVLIDAETHVERALALCAALRSAPATAHMRLLALIPGGQEQHYLDFLRAGVDQAFIRPAAPATILASLHALVPTKKCLHPTGAEPDVLDVFDLHLETGKRLVRHGDKQLQLSPTEFKLLSLLLRTPGRVCSRSELISAAWPQTHYVQPRTVDVHVGRLRRMLEQMTGRSIIRTIRSSGYAAELE